MKEILRYIDLTLLFILFGCTVVHFLKGYKCKSTTITAVSVITFDGFMALITPFLHNLQDTFSKEVVRFIWFTGFSVIDLAVVVAITKAHKRYSIKYRTSARCAVIGFTALALLHFPAYLDHQVFGTGVVTKMYMYAIPSINISISAVLVFGIFREDIRKWMS